MMDYKQYYRQKTGSGISAFQGARYQRGSGLGNVFRKFFSWILPVFKTHALPVITSGAKTIGREAIKSAANIATDSLNDVNFMSSLQNRSNEAINNLKNQYLQQQQGNGIKNKKRNCSSVRNKRKRNKLSHDIFD